MKANELMIGDWVEYRFTGWTKKDGVYENSQYVKISTIGKLYVKADNDRVASADGEDFYPIPITAEILEENGFFISPIFVEWKYENNGIYLLWKPFPWLQVSTDNADVNFACQYVHELQHALRLCGIEKEITI